VPRYIPIFIHSGENNENPYPSYQAPCIRISRDELSINPIIQAMHAKVNRDKSDDAEFRVLFQSANCIDTQGIYGALGLSIINSELR